MQNLKYCSILLLCCSTLSCFSAKGIPVKAVKAPTYKTHDKPSKDTINSDIKDDVQTDDITIKTLVDHTSWDTLLKKYVAANGDVDYKGFKTERLKLQNYIAYLATQIPTENWTVNEQLAYFINVYNANTIQLIIEHYPVKSIKDIKNPWLKNRLKIGEKDYSLADIENGILRKMNEPRIHFAINCASYSCPKLLNTAYTATNVQELMEQATKDFINDSEKNLLSANSIELSEIFKWYKGDFTNHGSLIDYINLYATIKISSEAKIDYITYNWDLNEQNP